MVYCQGDVNYMTVFDNKRVSQHLFLHNLSCWHYSTQPTFLQFWSAVPSPLSQAERTAINDWSELSRQAFAHAGEFLVTSEILQTLNADQRQEIDRIFSILDARFGFHYALQRSNIQRIVAYIQRVPPSKYLQETLSLYLQTYRPPDIFITLSHGANKAAGGMNLQNAVILQFGDYDLSQGSDALLNILYHEATHAGTLRPFIAEDIQVPLPPRFTGDAVEYVDEVLHQSLWSQVGLFSRRVFKWTDEQIARNTEHIRTSARSPHRELIQMAVTIQPLVVRYLNGLRCSTDHAEFVRGILEIVRRGDTG